MMGARVAITGRGVDWPRMSLDKTILIRDYASINSMCLVKMPSATLRTAPPLSRVAP